MFPKRKKQTDLEEILLRHRAAFRLPEKRKNPLLETLLKLKDAALSFAEKRFPRIRRNRKLLSSSTVHVSRMSMSAQPGIRTRAFDQETTSVSKKILSYGHALGLAIVRRPKYAALSIGAIVLIALIATDLFFAEHASGATYTWIQTQWTTLTANTTGHPAPGNWTEYAETTGSVSTGSSLTLSVAEVTDTQNVPAFSN